MTHPRTSTKPSSDEAIAGIVDVMSGSWLQVRVDLLDGPPLSMDSAGRIIAVAPSHTFAQLSRAINLAFGRWDLDCRYLFRDPANPSFQTGTRNYPNLSKGDPRDIAVASVFEPTDTFEYTYDVGEPWLHYCTVLPDLIDPHSTLGDIPGHPVAIDGWGPLPDPYGRTAFEDRPLVDA